MRKTPAIVLLTLLSSCSNSSEYYIEGCLNQDYDYMFSSLIIHKDERCTKIEKGIIDVYQTYELAKVNFWNKIPCCSHCMSSSDIKCLRDSIKTLHKTGAILEEHNKEKDDDYEICYDTTAVDSVVVDLDDYATEDDDYEYSY